MAALIAKDIQVLLDQPKGQGMLVSCYADTSVSDGFSPHWLQPFKTEASRIREQFADDHQARLKFEGNLDIIRRALESPAAKRARGMAVFSSTDRGFFLTLPATEPYENRLVVDEEPYVVPLVEAEFRQRGYLVVLSDTHRARWYAAGPGGSRLIDEKDRAVLKTTQADAESRVLSELDRRLHEATAVAAGPQEVIDALRNGQVAALIMGPDPAAMVSRCTGCRSSFVLAHSECPYCHAPCHRGNLWQELLALAVNHGVWVHRVQPSGTISRHEGVAALLARDEPQWATVSESKGTNRSAPVSGSGVALGPVTMDLAAYVAIQAPPPRRVPAQWALYDNSRSRTKNDATREKGGGDVKRSPLRQ